MIKNIISQNIHGFSIMCTAYQTWNIRQHFCIFICSWVHIVEGVRSPKQIFGTHAIWETVTESLPYNVAGKAYLADCRRKLSSTKERQWLQLLIHKDANSSVKTSRKDESLFPLHSHVLCLHFYNRTQQILSCIVLSCKHDA